MLNKKEVAVMKAIYNACKHNNDCTIVTDARIISSTPEKYKLTNNDVDIILKQLEYDGYFECTKSDLVQRRRELVSTFFWRMVFAALGAVVALAVNKLLGN